LIIEKVIEFNIDLFIILILLVFLGIRVYYSMKLVRLIHVKFSYTILEKRFLGMVGVLLIGFIIVIIINLYIRIVFRLRLEIVSFKLFIYLFVLVFFLIRVYTNLNFKFNSYNKLRSFKEIWARDVYILDKFIYWNIFISIEYFSILRKIKLFLLMNWWVCAMVVVLL